MFLFSFNGNVCPTKGQVLDVVTENIKFNQHFKGNELLPSVSIETIEELFQETDKFNLRKDKPRESSSEKVAEAHSNHQEK